MIQMEAFQDSTLKTFTGQVSRWLENHPDYKYVDFKFQAIPDDPFPKYTGVLVYENK